MQDFNSNNYDSSIFINFEFGCDDAWKTTSEEFDLHISYWSDDKAGSWCYVEHDSTGDYYAPVSMGDVEALGLRIDFPVTAKWTVARMKKAAKARGFKGYAKMKKAALLAMLTHVEPTEVEKLGTAAAKSALDQVLAYEHLMDAYFLNLSDTLNEMGIPEMYVSAYAAFEVVLVEAGIEYRPHGLWHSVAPGVTEESILGEMMEEFARLPKCKDGSINGNKRHGLEVRYINRFVKECGLGRNEACVVVHSRTCWHEKLRTDEYIARLRKEMKEYDNKLRMRLK